MEFRPGECRLEAQTSFLCTTGLPTRFTLLCLVTTLLPVLVSALQVPFGLNQAELPSTALREGPGDWNFDTVPNLNSTDHLVFETIHSLLLRWPNTRMRNGHAIVPGMIPKGTLLYHGRSNDSPPTTSEWFATDPEHSYIYGGGTHEEECWHFTFATTRPLKVLYFDGSSAAKLQDGTLDTQDLLVWGETRGGKVKEDRQRIKDICKWGERYNVDGYVRMQMDFEVMLCNITSGTRVISSSNLVSRLTGWPQKILLEIAAFELMNAASWHDRTPGEVRIRLDLTGLVTFYDTKLAPSLVPIRASQERWDHRVQNISSEDLSAAKSMLEQALTRPEGQSSGIDWAALIQVIIDRYAQRLELVRYLLNAPTSETHDVLELAVHAQDQLRIMLMPYLLHSVSPSDQPNGSELDWATPVFMLCATTHTQSMESDLSLMTDSEKLILQAVRGTSREICRVVTKMWAAGVHAGLDRVLNTKKNPDVASVTHLRRTWLMELNGLMTWLDWSEWVKCDPVCGQEEICYLPTWPIGFPGSDKVPYSGEIFPPVTDAWIRPQPKCIRQFEPYGF